MQSPPHSVLHTRNAVVTQPGLQPGNPARHSDCRRAPGAVFIMQSYVLRRMVRTSPANRHPQKGSLVETSAMHREPVSARTRTNIIGLQYSFNSSTQSMDPILTSWRGSGRQG